MGFYCETFAGKKHFSLPVLEDWLFVYVSHDPGIIRDSAFNSLLPLFEETHIHIFFFSFFLSQIDISTTKETTIRR